MFYFICLVLASIHLSSIVNALPLSTRLSNIAAERRDNTTSSISSTNSTSPKLVVAHHMVGNTYNYQLSDWMDDITLAHANGIDGFALNVGSDSWQKDRVTDAYTAAEQSGTGFKLFMSFDMSSLPCTDADSAATLRDYITSFSNSSAQLRYGNSNRVFVSTFAGESCTFGQDSVADGWKTQFLQHPDLTGTNAVYFAPSFFVDPATFGTTYSDAMDGAFNFNSGWPIQVTTSFVQQILSNIGSTIAALTSSNTDQSKLFSFVGATGTDSQYISALSGMPAESNGDKRIYMAAVSPWFFTHFGANTFNKNFIYLFDAHLYPTRWDNLISMRDQIDMVEIVTWNDYGESHYIGPIKGSLPTGSNAWVDGFDHTGWLNMTSYFATAFKTGLYPAVTEDKIVMWARPHPAAASADDPVGLPANADVTEDTLWAFTLATSPATVTLSTSSDNSTSQSFDVPAGMSKFSIPLTPGEGMRATMTRNGQTVIDLAPTNYTFDPNPTAYNFNAFVVSS